VFHPYIIGIIDTVPPPSYNRAAFSPLTVPVADALAVANREFICEWSWKDPVDAVRRCRPSHAISSDT